MKKPLNARESLNAKKVTDAINDLAFFVKQKLSIAGGQLALVGIHTRGVLLASRVSKSIQKEKSVTIPVGELDITLYRDDLGTAGIHPIVKETRLDFDINNKEIILIDDVLYTGRTIRAAIDELLDFGRPKKISLAVLIDRGHRELPIEAEFSALKIDTKPSESVNLKLIEVDDCDEIIVGEPIQ